jgi:hypothetical protein
MKYFGNIHRDVPILNNYDDNEIRLLEEAFWKNPTGRKAKYGADIQGSLCSKTKRVSGDEN